MNPATALATIVVDELIRCGTREAVLAPGSRSTPLAFALYDADRAGRLRLHVRIDERSAAFLALGLAKTDARPVPVVCTSGSAAANLHPAVIEASETGVPLLALTADRPPELRHTGANQTIDQLKLYGDAVRWFCEVGVPEARVGAVAYWRSTVCRAAACATGTDPGPVQLNLAFREPLIPGGDVDWPESPDGRPGGQAWTRYPEPATGPPDLPEVRRGVLVVGDSTVDPAPFTAHARAHGWPVLAEPSGNARRGANAISTYHHLLAVEEFAVAHRPDTIVTLGRPGLSKPLLRYLPTAAQHLVVAAGPRRPDPTRTATESREYARPFVDGPLDPPDGGPEGAWLAGWRRADRAARAALDAVLDADDRPDEPRLARDLARSVPEGSILVAGSSMPVRDLDQAMAPRTGLRVLANRGTSGIDGMVSTAVGAALAHQASGGGPGYALLGDLTVLHDQNGLILGPDEPRPDLTFVVVNNDGGGIFSGLPQAGLPGPFERLFGAPHRVDLAAVAASTGTSYRRLDDLAELPDALKGDGLRMIEVCTDRAQAAERRACIARAVTDAVRALRD